MIPWDRKDLLKERKHERSESLGSVPRWRDSSAHHGSSDFRPVAGHGKQGGWHLFPEESGNGHALSRSGDKMLEEDNGRQSVSQGDGKYGRSNRESRGSFSLRDWRGRSLETANGSVNLSWRQPDANNDQRSVDDMLTYSSHPHSDSVNTREQPLCKEQHDKMGGVNGYRESSLSSTEWKPLKWTRSGSLSLRGSGFGHSSSPRSIGGPDSCEGKAGLRHKIAAAVESNSGEAAACGTSASSEETNSRKKARLNWGEGLAKFEKKKVEGPDVSANKEVSSPIHMEPGNFLSTSLVEKSPKVSGFSDCASPSTPSSVAYNSSPGVNDKLFGKAANVDNGVSNLSGSPGPGSQNHLQMLSFNLEKVDIGSLSSLGSSLVELLQSNDLNSLDSSPLRSTTMNKLLILKADISKVLEVTETEIDLLENELKSLKSESADRFPCSAAAGSLLVCHNAKSCAGHVGDSDKVARPEPLQIVSSDDPNVEKMPLSPNLHGIHDNGKEDDIDSPGTAISKFVEPPPLINIASSCDMRRHDTCSEYLDGIQSTSVKCLIPCTYRQVASVSACDDGNSSMEVKDGIDAKSGVKFYSSTKDKLYNTIISCNKESAKKACEVFAKLLPEGCGKIGNIGASSGSCSRDGAFIMEKFAEKKRFARFKERVITLKFKALHHKWKEDMRLLSIRKCRLKSPLELGLRTISNGHQKNRSSIRFRFPFPAGKQHSLIPTSEMINYTSQLLSESSNKIHRSTLKMPALILDQKEKMISKFLSRNGLVEDPLAIEKERAMINLWTSKEREIFLEKFAAFGKDFRKIASFLDHKTTADCVEFYYKNHKSDCFEKIKKKDGGKLGKFFTVKTGLMASDKKWNSKVNAASLEILSAASVMADGIAGNRKMRPGCSIWRGYADMETSRGEDCITERSSSLDILQDERETVAADVLAGICGSLSSEAMSSRITSSVDPVEGNRDRKRMKVRSLCKQPMVPDVAQCIDDETCSDESCGEMDSTEWTDGEKAAFLRAVSSFGNNFAMIAECIGTRSQNQCKVFFSKARKCLRLDLMHPRPENIGSLMNDDGNGGRSDTDDTCVVETSSVIGTDTSGTKTDEDLPSSVMNTYHESNPMEARDLSAVLNESKDINGEEVDHEDVNMVSNACVNKGESKLGTDGNRVVLCSSDKCGSIGDQRTIILSDSIEIGKDKPNVVGGAVTELVSALEIVEPCHSNSVAEDRLVSEVSSGCRGNELEGSPTCLVDSDDVHEADKDVVVEMKNKVYDSSSTVNTSLSSVGISCSILSFDAENHPQLCLDEKSHFSGSLEDAPTTANSILKNMAGTALQCEKTVSQDLLSSNCDFQGSRDISGHNSSSNGGCQLHNPGNQLDEASRTLQCYPLQAPVKEVNADMSCSSSATELPLLSQKFEQADDHYKTQLRCLSDSEKTSRNGDVKLFGKILTNPSSTQKPNLTAKGNYENGTHNPKLSSTSCSLKFTGNHNADGRSAILKFDHNDYWGIENVPIMSYWDGSRIQSGFSSLPDSSILLAKNPTAYSDYPTSSKLEQQSLQASAKNDEQHLNGASAFTTREVHGSNGMIDYQMFKNRDDLKVQQPFMVDVKQRQDAFSEMQRRNGFEAISGLQQQGKGMVGINGVGGPGILVGGSQSGVSDPVAAIKMHYSNADQCGGRNGSITREDESWGGKGGI